MEKVLVDSCIIIDMLRGCIDTRNKIETIQKPFISFINTMELLKGATNKESLYKIKKELNSFYLLPMHNEIAKLSIQLIDKYSLSNGLTIPDSIIASTALVYSLPLFTLNIKDFKYINGLELFNPNF